MAYLEGRTYRYEVDERGQCRSLYSKLSRHEYVFRPDFTWRLIYAEGERTEIPVYPTGQQAEILSEEHKLTLRYPTLQGDGRTLDVSLTILVEGGEDRLSVSAVIENRDPAASVMELYLCPAAGVRSLGGDPTADAVTWPLALGRIIPQPALADLSVHSGFRKYERHDQYHTDLNGMYPGRLSMQWIDWFNREEGLYVGSHDATGHTVCLDCERDVAHDTLRLGIIQYPMIGCGERAEIPPVVLAPHLGDWHAGARIYRAWTEESGQYAVPDRPDWARDLAGWLRVILKQHHMECNWTYRDIPRLYDEAEAAGLRTLFLLGWEAGGFARMWPDYVPDEGALGGEALLKEGIDYVHSKGGKVLMFLSYSLLDHQSAFYRSGAGEKCTVKSIWGTEVPFAETYCGEGTYRKLGNPPMPMYIGCSGSDLWQQKMLDSADACLRLGADGVLYDLGGLPPYFCYDKRHSHAKPSHALEKKAERYRELRQEVKSFGEDRLILMEHAVDRFNRYMDVAQPSGIQPGYGDDPQSIYRYTFPEVVLTNREHGQDEHDYKHMINHTIALGLRFDMTIWRCCGTLSDIPNYTAYLTEMNAYRQAHAKYLLRGLFRDNDGITWDNPAVKAYAYEAEDGTRAAVVWNDGDEPQAVRLTFDSGIVKEADLAGQQLQLLEEKAE